MAALATRSAVCGRRVYTPTGLTLALYLAMLAKTGQGKDAPLKAPARFLHAATLGLMAQPGKTFTVSGFEQCLIDSKGSCVATCDEIGDNLLRKILSKKAMPFEVGIKTFLMELAGMQDDSAPFNLTKRAANGVDAKAKGAIVDRIPNPSFSLFGASTPVAFYAALGSGAIGDGSLNRFLIIEADPAPDEENIVDDVVPIPANITAALTLLSGVGATKKHYMTGGFLWPGIASERAAWAEGAKQRYALLGKQISAVIKADAPFAELYARVRANALKVAALIAVSRAVGERAGGNSVPEVTIDDIEKGAAMALESAVTTVDGAMLHMADSEFETNCKTLLKLVEEAGPAGIKESVLHRKPGASKIEPRKFKDATEHLTRTAQWEEKRGKTGRRYIRLGGRVAVDADD